MSCLCDEGQQAAPTAAPADPAAAGRSPYAFTLNIASPLPWPERADKAHNQTQDPSGPPKASAALKDGPAKGRESRHASIAYVQQLYYSTLWQGEAYAPITDFARFTSLLFTQCLEQQSAHRTAAAASPKGDSAASAEAQPSSHDGIVLLAEVLQTLMRSGDHVRRRMREIVPACMHRAAREAAVRAAEVGTSSTSTSVEPTGSCAEAAAAQGGSGLSAVEWKRLVSSLASGPAASVRLHLEQQQQGRTQAFQEDVQVDGIVKAWLTAMECRELQLQILLTLLALRVCASDPTALERHRQRVSRPQSADYASAAAASQGSQEDSAVEFQVDSQTQLPESQLESQAESQMETQMESQMDSQATAAGFEESPGDVLGESQLSTQGRTEPGALQESGARNAAPPAAKKRKLKARKFNPIGGANPTFQWQRRKTSNRRDGKGLASSAAPAPQSDAEVALDVASLSTRFEVLTDKLCLLTLVTGLGDVGGSDSQGSSQAEAGQRQSASSKAPSLFGTAARIKDVRDERDEVQYFCSSVVKHFFASALPRQYAALRSKCFVSAADATGSGFDGTPARPGLSATTAASSKRSKSDTLLAQGSKARTGKAPSSAERRDLDLAAREEKRVQRERAVAAAAKESFDTDALRRELDEQSRKRMRRESSVGPGGASAAMQVEARDKVRLKAEVDMGRTFKRSASAVFGADGLRGKAAASRGGAEEGAPRTSTAVFAPRPFERTQSLANRRSATPGLADAAPRQARHASVVPEQLQPLSRGRQASVPPPRARAASEVPQRSAESQPSAKPQAEAKSAEEPADDKAKKRSRPKGTEKGGDLEDSGDESSSSEENGREAQDDDEPMETVAISKPRAGFTLKSIGLVGGGAQRALSASQSAESQPAAATAPSRNPFARATSQSNAGAHLSATAGANAGLQRVKSGRNPFAKGALPLPGGAPDLADPLLLTESCPAELGRMWRGAAPRSP